MSDPTYAPVPQAPGQPPADHSVKVPHLVFGLLFLGIAGIWALGASDAISGEHLAVLGPAVLILAGVVGLAVSLANGRNRRRRATTGYQPDNYLADNYQPASYEAPANQTTSAATDDITNDVTDDGDEHTEEIR